MRLVVLLQILRALEGLAADRASVRLMRDMHTDMRGDMVPLDRLGFAVGPVAFQIQVVGGLATDMAITDMFLSSKLRSVIWVLAFKRPSYAKRLLT